MSEDYIHIVSTLVCGDCKIPIRWDGYSMTNRSTDYQHTCPECDKKIEIPGKSYPRGEIVPLSKVEKVEIPRDADPGDEQEAI